MDRVGPYVIDRKIGTGGMGTVYLARHESTGLAAAVKVLPASLAREEGFLLRFEREIAALRQLDNPHVVKIYESGAASENGAAGDPADGQAFYYAMEYVDGETLLAKLRRERRLPWPTAIDYGVQVCVALKAAHDAGIVHRDLKPSNLLISSDGRVKLADFGVAQVFAASRLTKTGGIIGTAEFMSPEQAQGQRATKKSDLYALGAVLYTMLAGKPPYSGQTMLDVLHKHRFGQYDRPRNYAPDCPIWLEEVIVQLLEKDPDKRPSDAYVTGRRLREIPRKVELSQSEPLPAHASGAGQPAGPPAGQEILSPDDAAGEQGAEYDGDAPTRTAYGSTARDMPAGSRGPGEATIMHALMRDEIARQQELHPVRKFFENTWVLVGLLALLAVGGWFWYRSLPTPEWHLAEANRIIGNDEDQENWLAARRDHLDPILERQGPWQEKAKELKEKVDRYEAAKPLIAGTLRAKRDRPGVGAASSSEPSRLLRRAEAQLDAGDVSAALGTLEAIVAVTKGQPGLEEEHGEAEESLRTIRKGEAERRAAFISAMIARAGELGRDPEKASDAEAIYRGLVTLYGDDPTVDAALAPARRALGGASSE